MFFFTFWVAFLGKKLFIWYYLTFTLFHLTFWIFESFQAFKSSFVIRKNACLKKSCPLLIRIKYCCFDSYWRCKISWICHFWARIQWQVCRSHACNTNDFYQRTQYFQVCLVNKQGYSILQFKGYYFSDFIRVWFI